MRFERLDLNLLVALDALLEEQNVSAAAERVCLSQSAMSGALSRLREYFDDELLTSVGRRMVLTPRALELAAPVRNALLLIKTTIATKPEFDPQTSTRKFVIVCSDYIMDVLMTPVLRRMEAEAPSLQFEFLTPSDGMLGRMEAGEIDLFITLEQYLLPDQPKELLFEEEHVVVACRNNLMLTNGIDARLYYELPHVAAQFGPTRSPAFIEKFFEHSGEKRRIELAVPYFSMIPSLLVGTNRIATMLRRHAEHYARLLPVKIHPLPLQVPRVWEAVQWHGLKGSDRALLWLVDRIRRYAADDQALGLAA